MSNLCLWWFPHPTHHGTFVTEYQDGYLYVAHTSLQTDEGKRVTYLVNSYGDIIGFADGMTTINGFEYCFDPLAQTIPYLKTSTPMILYRFIRGNILHSLYTNEHPVWTPRAYAGTFFIDDRSYRIVEFAVACLPEDMYRDYEASGFTVTKQWVFKIGYRTIAIAVGSGSFRQPATLRVDGASVQTMRTFDSLKNELRELGMIEFNLSLYPDEA